MRKRLFILLIILLNIFATTVFAREIEFNFNTPVGKAIFSVEDSSTTQEAIFYNGKLHLNLDEKTYNFIFSSDNYPLVERKIDVSKSNSVLSVYFSRKDSVTVNGNVKSENSNIGGAKITFMNSQNIGYNTTTDIFGNFSIDIPKGNYKVSLSKENFIDNRKNSIIYDFLSSDIPYYLKLSLKELPSFLRGQAIDDEGNSIPYPEFYIKSESDTFKVTGDQFGIFSLDISPGVVTILAQKDGYIENGIVRDVEKNSSITNIEIQLKRIKATISGVVTDGVMAIPKATVVLRDKDFNKIASVKSNSDGFYEFYKIPSTNDVFITIMKSNKILLQTELFNLDKDIKDFNLILE